MPNEQNDKRTVVRSLHFVAEEDLSVARGERIEVKVTPVRKDGQP